MALNVFRKIPSGNYILLLSIILAGRRYNCITFNEVSYSFGYTIDAARFGVRTHHFEDRKGDYVKGSYSLLEPSGRVRVVEYQVDGRKGFQAVVHTRQPAGHNLIGHLRFPIQYRTPIQLMRPVSLITPELLYGRRTYPNIGV